MGDHIVIAYDGAIVYVGDHGSLTANSGDAIGGGTVALDADRSTFSSNYDPTVLVPGRAATSATSQDRTAGGGVLTGSPASGIPLDASPLVSAFISYTGNRTADIAGFEDHSILTRGIGNVVTYDDSNVFMNRDGKINANTGTPTRPASTRSRPCDRRFRPGRIATTAATTKASSRRRPVCSTRATSPRWPRQRRLVPGHRR